MRRIGALVFGAVLVVGVLGIGHLLADAASAFERSHAEAATVVAKVTAAPTVVRTPRPIATTRAVVVATPTPAPLPPDYVARISSPTLKLENYVTRLGVINNQMQSPDADGVHAIGWYPEYATPGRGGNAVFSAHETWEFQHGPFYSMHLAKPGDELTIQMTSGATYRYVVTSNRRYPEATIPMGDIIWPGNEPPGEEWATFITCGGRFVRTESNGLGEYLDRDVVVAKRLS
ncbi:MAG: class F sortase [Chloroflexi bacterium]|nr:MAG: class F sortase [Chloroflexota bacterium]